MDLCTVRLFGIKLWPEQGVLRRSGPVENSRELTRVVILAPNNTNTHLNYRCEYFPVHSPVGVCSPAAHLLQSYFQGLSVPALSDCQ